MLAEEHDAEAAGPQDALRLVAVEREGANRPGSSATAWRRAASASSHPCRSNAAW